MGVTSCCFRVASPMYERRLARVTIVAGLSEEYCALCSDTVSYSLAPTARRPLRSGGIPA
jgi:hypothetical protein